MKLNEDFLIHDTGNGEILIATGETSKTFHGIIKLNGTGSKIAHLLEKEISLEEIEQSFYEEYPEEDKELIKSSILSFIESLKKVHAIID